MPDSRFEWRQSFLACVGLGGPQTYPCGTRFSLRTSVRSELDGDEVKVAPLDGAMNPARCQQLDAEIRRITLGRGLGLLKRLLDETPDAEECIAGGLLRGAAGEDWLTL